MNSSPDSSTFDVLVLGDTVVDFISSEVVARLKEACSTHATVLEEYAGCFLQWGVILVVSAKGLFSTTNACEQYQIIPHQISAVAATGTGDTFWSGFLAALLAGLSLLKATRVGRAIAEIKIGAIGLLTYVIDCEAIFAKAQSIQYHITM